jgi:hypothetical protein
LLLSSKDSRGRGCKGANWHSHVHTRRVLHSAQEVAYRHADLRGRCGAPVQVSERLGSCCRGSREAGPVPAPLSGQGGAPCIQAICSRRQTAQERFPPVSSTHTMNPATWLSATACTSPPIPSSLLLHVHQVASTPPQHVSCRPS